MHDSKLREDTGLLTFAATGCSLPLFMRSMLGEKGVVFRRIWVAKFPLPQKTKNIRQIAWVRKSRDLIGRQNMANIWRISTTRHYSLEFRPLWQPSRGYAG